MDHCGNWPKRWLLGDVPVAVCRKAVLKYPVENSKPRRIFQRFLVEARVSDKKFGERWNFGCSEYFKKDVSMLKKISNCSVGVGEGAGITLS